MNRAIMEVAFPEDIKLILEGKCPECRMYPKRNIFGTVIFSNELRRKDYSISGVCNDCQAEIFAQSEKIEQMERDKDCAFEAAIASGRLSVNPHADNYEGNYDYMGASCNGGDSFKNYRTRKMLPH
jgi:hypothetical protein